MLRETLIHYWRENVVADAGLIAHGRGEAFDYLIGEATMPPAREAVSAASAYLLLSRTPVISVNGNAAALVAADIVRLARIVRAKIEVNLFHRTKKRVEAVTKLLREAGATEVLGSTGRYGTIAELSSKRRIVDPRGILVADLVLIPLEDGDRAQALRSLGKTVIAVDLNPLSRTSQAASVTIVDNVVRAMPNLVSEVERLREETKERLRHIVQSYDNRAVLSTCLEFIEHRIGELASVRKVM